MTAIGKQMKTQHADTHDKATSASVSAIAARACAALVEGVDSAFDGMDTPFLPAAEDATRLAVAAICENAGVDAAGREKTTQCLLLRDILGNPFRPDHCSAAWQTHSVVSLANEIYRERWFGRLPELATVLIEAGCDSDVILNHCRNDEPHVRGCWVVDMFVERETRLLWS